MNSDDTIEMAMQPHLEEQARATARVRYRCVRRAKFFLVVATALFSGYAACTAYRYLTLDAFDPMSLLVLAVLAAGVRDRWRAA